MLRLIEHVLEPVGAVGHLQRDPVVLVVVHASMPVRTETENLAVEMIFGSLVVDEESGVDHPARNGIRLSRRGVALGALDEFDVVSLGIANGEGEAVVGAAFDLARLESLVSEVAAQGSDVVGGEGNVIHAISGLGIGRGTVSDPLLARHVTDGLAGLDRVGGGESEDVGVKMLHAIGRGRVEGDMIDAGDVRAGSGHLGECGRDAEKKDDEVLHGEMIVVQAGLRK